MSHDDTYWPSHHHFTWFYIIIHPDKYTCTCYLELCQSVVLLFDYLLCNSSQTLPASIASSCQVCCPVMIVVLVCLSHRHRPTTATYYRHTYYIGTPPWTIEICPTILRLTQGRTFSAMVSHTCQPVKCPVPWGHLSLLSCTTLLGWGLNVWGYQ